MVYPLATSKFSNKTILEFLSIQKVAFPWDNFQFNLQSDFKHDHFVNYCQSKTILASIFILGQFESNS